MTYDKGFAAGLRTAAQMAKASARRCAREGAAGKWAGAHDALDELANCLDGLSRPSGAPGLSPENPPSPEPAAAPMAAESDAA